MPSTTLLLPVLAPVVAAGVVAAFGAARIEVGRIVGAAGAWASVASLLAIWIPVRSTQELILGPLGFGSSFDFRVDAVAFAFALMVAVPAATLLTFQKRSWHEAALASLALAAAMAAVESDGVVLTAIAGGTAATLAVLMLDTEDVRAPRPSWGMLLAGWLALAWAGTVLQVRGGTAVYSAVPVSSVTWQVVSLLGLAALFASGLFPWRSWPSQLWGRPSLRAAGAVLVTLYPLGFYILVRVYDMGDGRYPSGFNSVLSVLGVGVALVAALRAQAAPTRHEFLGEVVPAAGGMAMMSLALGTPLGLAAGIVTLAGAAALGAAVVLLPDASRTASLVATAAAVGLPPGLFFGARVLGVEATFEAGDFMGLIGVAAACVWALWIAAGARAAGLPAGEARDEGETSSGASIAVAAATILAGPALAVVMSAFADPAAAEVMPSAGGSLSGGLTSVETVSTVLPAATLLLPLLLLGAAGYLAVGTALVEARARAPLIAPVFPRALESLKEMVRTAQVPAQYRSILSFRELEAAAGGGRPVLWIAALFALAFAVTR